MSECLQNRSSDRESDRWKKQNPRYKNEPNVCTFLHLSTYVSGFMVRSFVLLNRNEPQIHLRKWIGAKNCRRLVRFCIEDFMFFSDPIGDQRVDSEGIRSALSIDVGLIPIDS